MLINPVAPIIGAFVQSLNRKRQRQHRFEEEVLLTGYKSDGNTNWEFKVVCSSTFRFKSRKTIERLRAEEAQAGWEMIEKFDNSRIRFKRPTDGHTRSANLSTDNNFGLSLSTKVIVIFGILVLIVVLVLLFNTMTGLAR